MGLINQLNANELGHHLVVYGTWRMSERYESCRILQLQQPAVWLFPSQSQGSSNRTKQKAPWPPANKSMDWFKGIFVQESFIFHSRTYGFLSITIDLPLHRSIEQLFSDCVPCFVLNMPIFHGIKPVSNWLRSGPQVSRQTNQDCPRIDCRLLVGSQLLFPKLFLRHNCTFLPRFHSVSSIWRFPKS